jgi:hypothetical protein
MPTKRMQYRKYQIGIYFEHSEKNFVNILRSGLSLLWYQDGCIWNVEYIKVFSSWDNIIGEQFKDFMIGLGPLHTHLHSPLQRLKFQTSWFLDITVESENHSFVSSGKDIPIVQMQAIECKWATGETRW